MRRWAKRRARSFSAAEAYRKRDFVSAIALLRKALKTLGDDGDTLTAFDGLRVTALSHMGHALRETKDTEGAIGALNSALGVLARAAERNSRLRSGEEVVAARVRPGHDVAKLEKASAVATARPRCSAREAADVVGDATLRRCVAPNRCRAPSSTGYLKHPETHAALSQRVSRQLTTS